MKEGSLEYYELKPNLKITSISMRVNDSSLNYVGFFQERKASTAAAFSEYGHFNSQNLAENE